MNKWHKLFIVSLGIVFLFALMDTMQIVAVHETQQWDVYNAITAPAILFLWYAVLVVFGIFYYVLKKDKSESVAVVAAPMIMLFFGLEDFFFFLIKGEWITPCMDWFSYAPHTWVNSLLGVSCTSFKTLSLTALAGVGVSYFVFVKLKEAKW